MDHLLIAPVDCLAPVKPDRADCRNAFKAEVIAERMQALSRLGEWTP